MTPINLSSRQVKAMDRVGGADLILPWPEDLPRGESLDLDEERDATPAEHARAEQIVGPACRQHELVHVRSLVAMLQRPQKPDNIPRPGEIDQHLIARIIGRRWVHATGTAPTRSGQCWYVG